MQILVNRKVRKMGFSVKIVGWHPTQWTMKRAELMLRVRDVIQIAHQCTMQEREKQPASNAGEKKKEIVTTCSRD